MPISRVRSVTDTSMMFITPIPPTSSEIAATSPSSVVNTLLLEFEVCRIELWLMTLKLLDELDPALGGSSWLRMSVTSVWAAFSAFARLGLHDDLVDAAVAGERVLHRGERRDRDVVLVGRAVGSLGGGDADDLEVRAVDLDVVARPGRRPPNSSCTTVGPTTSTRRAPSPAALVNHEPSAIE